MKYVYPPLSYSTPFVIESPGPPAAEVERIEPPPNPVRPAIGFSFLTGKNESNIRK
jgi:hypothetical protein